MSPHSSDLTQLAQAAHELGVQPRQPAAWAAAGLRMRLGAALIDCMFAIFIIMGTSILTLLIGDFDGPELNKSRENWVLVLTELLMMAVYLACDACFARTPGKAFLGLRVIPTGSWSHGPLILRWFLRCAPLFLAAIIAGERLFITRNAAYSTFVPTFWDREATIYLPIGTFAAVLLLAVIPFANDGSPWYDRCADTQVVRRASYSIARGFDPVFPPLATTRTAPLREPPPPVA